MIPIKYSTVGEKHMKIDMKDTLRALRQKEKITQKTLAAYLGITPQSVGKWERGEGFPDISLLPRIACFFGVSMQYRANTFSDAHPTQMQRRIVNIMPICKEAFKVDA